MFIRDAIPGSKNSILRIVFVEESKRNAQNIMYVWSAVREQSTTVTQHKSIRERDSICIAIGEGLTVALSSPPFLNRPSISSNFLM